MSDKFQEFLGELSDDGTKQEGSTTFTLRSDKAKEKLKKFALAHPENYFLLIIAALHTLGARKFELMVDADDLSISADCSIKEESLKKLWAHVAGGASTEDAVGLRLLALAILTSVRFKSAAWTVEVANGQEGYTFRQQVKSGELPEPSFGTAPVLDSGCRVWVKRKNLKQVASRFFRQLRDRFTKSKWLEEELIGKRLFLGFFESFRLNGDFLDCRLRAQEALALLHVGGGPSFLSARSEFRKEGESSLTVIFTPLEKDLELPGEQGQIQWLWHGLTMGETELNVHAKFARVFVEADGMATDLSLTAIPDTWARQKVVRNARQAVRDLVELLVLDFTERHGSALSGHDEQIEDIILDVLGERIDISRSRHRLARFNRNLIACPLFTGSDESGVKKRYTLADLWERVSNNEQIAFFSEREEWEDVPAWPGRPVVIYSRMSHARALDRIFGGRILERAGRLLERLGRFQDEGEKEAAKESIVVDFENPWSGQIEFLGDRLDWEWSESNGKRGRLLVVRDDAPYFMDDTLGLPQGFRFVTRASWLPDYEGRLADKEASKALRQLAVCSMIEALEKFEAPPTAMTLPVSAAIWAHLGGKYSRWKDPGLLDRKWCIVTNQGSTTGFGFTHLNDYKEKASKSDIPSYALHAEDLENFDSSVYEAPCLVIPKHEAEELSEELGRPLLSARGLKHCQERPQFAPDPNSYLTFEYSTLECLKLDARLSQARVSFPRRRVLEKDEASRAWLHTNLRTGSLQRRSFSSFVAPLDVCLDWTHGWPDSRGTHFADRRQTEDSKIMAQKVVGWAAKELIGLPFDQALQVEPLSLSTAWFECWTDQSCEELPLFWVSDGSRVSPSEIRARVGSVRWYGQRTKDSAHHVEAALWVPDDVVDMLDENVEWLHIDAEPESEPETAKSALQSQSAETVLVQPGATAVPPPKAPEPKPKEVSMPTEESEAPALLKAQMSQVSDRFEEIQAKVKVDDKPEPATSQKTKSKESIRSRVDSSHHPFARALLDELGEISQLGKIPFVREFEHFVTKFQWEKSPEVYQLPSGLELPASKAQSFFHPPDQAKILILLSSLFSLFNRELEDVEDHHERKFQDALNKRCLKLFCRSL